MQKLFVSTWCLVVVVFFNPIISVADVVTVSGSQILVNNAVYLIKGVCYNPVPKGSDERSWSSLTTDLALMNEAGINTIRVYAPIVEKWVLDSINKAGIKVIVSFGYNQGGNYDILSGTYLNYIETFKNHDAILFWEFGNEYNYHPEWFNNDINNWYTALNDAAFEVHYADENHPVSTAHGELPNGDARLYCPEVDVWGMNVYRWDNPETVFNEWKQVSEKPMYLSESGADRYMTKTMNGYTEGENEDAQADATKNILDDVFKSTDICSGVTLFEFTDEWWKDGNFNNHDSGGWAPNSSGVPYDGAPNEEYWGILKVDRGKTQAFEVLKAKYNSITTAINTNKQNALCAYPNPVNDAITILGIKSKCHQIEILNIDGKIHKCISGNFDSVYSLNVNNFTPGLYIAKVVCENSVEFISFIKK